MIIISFGWVDSPALATFVAIVPWVAFIVWKLHPSGNWALKALWWCSCAFSWALCSLMQLDFELFLVATVWHWDWTGIITLSWFTNLHDLAGARAIWARIHSDFPVAVSAILRDAWVSGSLRGAGEGDDGHKGSSDKFHIYV